MSGCEQQSPGPGSVLDRLLVRGRRERLPLLASIELTRRCPLDCLHCYLGFARDTPPEEELTRDELLGLFDQFRAEGTLFLTFTGGEPLFREDFREIYLGALRKGFLVTIFTAGTLIDRNIADFFSRYPPFHLDVTILGASEETFDRIAGHPGSFRRSREAIRLLAEREISFGLKSVVGALNREELGEMKSFSRKYGKNFRFDSLICPQLDGSRDNLRHRLEPWEVVRLDREDGEKWREWRDHACRTEGVDSLRLLYACGGGLTSFHVNHRGKLSLCVLDTNFHFNLREGSFREAWREFIPRVRATPADPENPCPGCRLRNLCTSCPAWSRMETGNPGKPSDFLCQIAQVRAKFIDNENKKAVPQT